MAEPGLAIAWEEEGFTLSIGGIPVLRHTPDAPAVFLGHGRADIDMARGNFRIADRLDARVPLSHAWEEDGQVQLSALEGAPARLTLTLDGGALRLAANDDANRLWVRLLAEPEERVWGGGEQMSHVNLRGRHWPLWTSEPGVGRDKTTLLTWKADLVGAGGDYHTTNYPQPTLISERHYAAHLDTTAWCAFDLRDAHFHELEAWAVPERIEFFAAPTIAGLVTRLSTRFGRQPRLPEWAISGAIVGLKDGLRSFDRLDAIVEAGAAVTGLWCEDWVGLRETSFGRRLFWDWQASAARYPGLAGRIAGLAERGIRFLGYVNPYLAVDGPQFAEARARGFLGLHPTKDEPYEVDFGEFHAGVVDFTNPAAAEWFAEAIIGRQMIDGGQSGWMADFGEYLPTDVRLANGVDGTLMHNAWPVLWAEVNARAVADRGRTGDIVFFMRAGWSGVGAHCPLLWAGDQSVDWSRHDGIGTVVRAALSSGLVGNAYHHSDLGGYTSLFGNVRTPELMMRWSELSAFSPVMRSHEGNRPDDNLQLDGDAEVLAHFARMSQVHRALAPYVGHLCDEAVKTGLPLQRPMFVDWEADRACWDVETQFAYGPELIVAPVLEPGVTRWACVLPAGTDWVHLWLGAPHPPGVVTVDAPFGQPPVFYDAAGAHAALFAGLAERFRQGSAPAG